jgi:hypothetical protein
VAPDPSYPGKLLNLRWHRRPLLEPGDAQKHTAQGRKAAPAGGPNGSKSGGSITPKSGGPIQTKSGGSNHSKSCSGARRRAHCDSSSQAEPSARSRGWLCPRISSLGLDREPDPDRATQSDQAIEPAVAGIASAGVRAAPAGTHEVIRIDAAWIAVEPLDMRAGVDTALAQVVKVFGEARSHHACMFHRSCVILPPRSSRRSLSRARNSSTSS